MPACLTSCALQLEAVPNLEHAPVPCRRATLTTWVPRTSPAGPSRRQFRRAWACPAVASPWTRARPSLGPTWALSSGPTSRQTLARCESVRRLSHCLMPLPYLGFVLGTDIQARHVWMQLCAMLCAAPCCTLHDDVHCSMLRADQLSCAGTQQAGLGPQAHERLPGGHRGDRGSWQPRRRLEQMKPSIAFTKAPVAQTARHHRSAFLQLDPSISSSPCQLWTPGAFAGCL